MQFSANFTQLLNTSVCLRGHYFQLWINTGPGIVHVVQTKIKLQHASSSQ